MKLEERGKKNSDIHMNTKLIHYDQCYYNEHKINSSQWNTQSTTHLLYLLTKNNRTIILHWGDTRGHGHCRLVSHTGFPSLGVDTTKFLQGGSFPTTFKKAKDMKNLIPSGFPYCCCSLPGLGPGKHLGCNTQGALIFRVLTHVDPCLA